VPQAIAIAEAFERGKARAARAGLLSDAKPLHSYAVLMVGRLDDHLRDIVKERGMDVDQQLLAWAGVAVGKRAYKLFRDRGYGSKLLIAALRGNYHIDQFIGGDLVISMPPNVEEAFGRHVDHRLPPALIDAPVPARIVDQLSDRFVDFRRAYAPDGMRPGEFDSFGPTVKTLDQFSQNWEGLIHFIDDAGSKEARA
jgi:transaldolase